MHTSDEVEAAAAMAKENLKMLLLHYINYSTRGAIAKSHVRKS